MSVDAQAHQSDVRILSRRTLARDHRQLARLLRTGLSVLDVGCGTGAITSGIAKAVGPGGFVVGVDRDAGLVEMARREYGGLGNLEFQVNDATILTFPARFDIVTAARTLQWLSDPGLALLQMRHAAKPGGWVVVLDYNHTANAWEPDPPAVFLRFYRAFLDWRDAHGWDNEMAEHLPALFRGAGLVGIESHVQDEVLAAGDPEFAEQAELWSQVMEKVGEQIVNEGFLAMSHLGAARECYDAWARTNLVRQTLNLRAVVSRVS